MVLRTLVTPVSIIGTSRLARARRSLCAKRLTGHVKSSVFIFNWLLVLPGDRVTGSPWAEKGVVAPYPLETHGSGSDAPPP